MFYIVSGLESTPRSENEWATDLYRRSLKTIVDGNQGDSRSIQEAVDDLFMAGVLALPGRGQKFKQTAVNLHLLTSPSSLEISRFSDFAKIFSIPHDPLWKMSAIAYSLKLKKQLGTRKRVDHYLGKGKALEFQQVFESWKEHTLKGTEISYSDFYIYRCVALCHYAENSSFSPLRSDFSLTSDNSSQFLLYVESGSSSLLSSSSEGITMSSAWMQKLTEIRNSNSNGLEETSSHSKRTSSSESSNESSPRMATNDYLFQHDRMLFIAVFFKYYSELMDECCKKVAMFGGDLKLFEQTLKDDSFTGHQEALQAVLATLDEIWEGETSTNLFSGPNALEIPLITISSFDSPLRIARQVLERIEKIGTFILFDKPFESPLVKLCNSLPNPDSWFRRYYIPELRHAERAGEDSLDRTIVVIEDLFMAGILQPNKNVSFRQSALSLARLTGLSEETNSRLKILRKIFEGPFDSLWQLSAVAYLEMIEKDENFRGFLDKEYGVDAHQKFRIVLREWLNYLTQEDYEIPYSSLYIYRIVALCHELVSLKDEKNDFSKIRKRILEFASKSNPQLYFKIVAKVRGDFLEQAVALNEEEEGSFIDLKTLKEKLENSQDASVARELVQRVVLFHSSSETCVGDDLSYLKEPTREVRVHRYQLAEVLHKVSSYRTAASLIGQKYIDRMHLNRLTKLSDDAERRALCLELINQRFFETLTPEDFVRQSTYLFNLLVTKYAPKEENKDQIAVPDVVSALSSAVLSEEQLHAIMRDLETRSCHIITNLPLDEFKNKLLREFSHLKGSEKEKYIKKLFEPYLLFTDHWTQFIFEIMYKKVKTPYEMGMAYTNLCLLAHLATFSYHNHLVGYSIFLGLNCQAVSRLGLILDSKTEEKWSEVCKIYELSYGQKGLLEDMKKWGVSVHPFLTMYKKQMMIYAEASNHPCDLLRDVLPFLQRIGKYQEAMRLLNPIKWKRAYPENPRSNVLAYLDGLQKLKVPREYASEEADLDVAGICLLLAKNSGRQTIRIRKRSGTMGALRPSSSNSLNSH